VRQTLQGEAAETACLSQPDADVVRQEQRGAAADDQKPAVIRPAVADWIAAALPA
jgi:hypothetical protein